MTILEPREYVDCFITYGHKIIGGSSFGAIHIWDSNTGQIERDLMTIGSASVKNFLLTENTLLVVSQGGFLTIYDLNTYSIIDTYNFDAIKFIYLLDNDRVVLGSSDHNIDVLYFREQRLIRIYTGHNGLIIKAIKVNGYLLFETPIGIYRLNCDTGYINKLGDHLHMTYMDYFFSNYIITTSRADIMIWNIDTLQRVRQIITPVDIIDISQEAKIAIRLHNNTIRIVE